METLYNVRFFSKLSHGHFSANITKSSEQLSSTHSQVILLMNKSEHVKLDNILEQDLDSKNT